jgi:signal transduction histidine kinase
MVNHKKINTDAVAAELVDANEKLAFENEEKAKRATELVIANEDKADRAAELVIANEEKSDLERHASQLAELADNEAKLVEALNYEINVKDRFFSIIAHDLKSPFNGLLGYTQIMSQMANSSSKDELVEYAKNANEAGNKVFELLQNLLEWSRLQMEGGKVEFEVIELEKITQECINILIPNAAGKNVTLLNKITHTMAFADRNMVLTVIRNLIANSIKFTPAGGTVEVSAQTEGNKIKVMVTDNGVGMTSEFAVNIFALDKKTTSIGTDGEKGTGLGLPLCKEMVEKCEGEIWCESTIDKGTTFAFTLPIKPSA